MTTNHDHLREVKTSAWMVSEKSIKYLATFHYELHARETAQNMSDDGYEPIITPVYEIDMAELKSLLDELAALRKENERLNAIINAPQADDFLRAVSTEAEHQRQRWGSDHDQGKAPADWFWLVGYLAGKVLHKHAVGDVGKAEHHIITTAAACANWHRAMFGKTNMRPGIDAARVAIGDSHE